MVCKGLIESRGELTINATSLYDLDGPDRCPHCYSDLSSSDWSRRELRNWVSSLHIFACGGAVGEL